MLRFAVFLSSALSKLTAPQSNDSNMMTFGTINMGFITAISIKITGVGTGPADPVTAGPIV